MWQRSRPAAASALAQSSTAAGLVVLSMLLGTAGSLFTSVVAQDPAGSGHPAHTHAHVANLLGSIDLLAAATPPPLRPCGPHQLAARICILKYAKLLLQPEVRQVEPLLYAGASSRSGGAVCSRRRHSGSAVLGLC